MVFFPHLKRSSQTFSHQPSLTGDRQASDNGCFNRFKPPENSLKMSSLKKKNPIARKGGSNPAVSCSCWKLCFSALSHVMGEPQHQFAGWFQALGFQVSMSFLPKSKGLTLWTKDVQSNASEMRKRDFLLR